MFFKILLFDIDGTLLLSGQAGYRALTRTFKELFGVARGFDDIPVAGMTDESILTAALERAGVAADLETRARFHTRYCELLADEIHFPGPRKGLMRGVAALLETLSRCNDIRCGLVTGNFARPAQIKLEHFELWRFFHFGAYGDDAPVRDELVPDAAGSSRQGCNPAGASPAVSIAQVGHVAMPHPGMGNHPGDAWCKRPGRPARRCCGGCNLGA